MTCALVVLDVQESFGARQEWAGAHDPDVAQKVRRLVDEAREADVQVIWVLHTEPGTGTVFDPDRGLVQLMPGLEPRPDEPVLVKTTINAFTSTDLESRLHDAGVDHLVICGIRTEQCCETTVRLASDLGFQVTLALDGTTTTPAGDLSASEVIERTATVLEARGFASISTIERVAHGWRADRSR